MKLLLDTQVLIWADAEPAKLSPAARRAIEDPGNQLMVSLASLWEMQIKEALGKLGLARSVKALFLAQTDSLGVNALPIKADHVWQLASLPRLHGDPFDRLVIAQAQFESLPIVTADSAFREYQVEVVW